MNINRNLISLKCILFLVFGAIGSLFPFLPLHMNSLGLSKDESIVVSIVAPIIALIGPLVAAPLADRLAGTSSNTSKGRNGAYLRVMIAVSLAFATILYWLLLVIPPIKKNANVTFICNEEGGYVLQDRCGTNCYDWNTDKGSLLVKNCIYTCNETSAYQVHESTLPSFLKESHEATGSDSDSYYDGDSGSDVIPDLEVEVTTTPAPAVETATGIYFEPHPHMCYRNDTGYDLCEVYTDYSKPINFHIGLKSSVPFSSPENRTCKFPTFESFQCRIRPDVQKNLTNYVKDCKPIVICEIHNPYNNENSLLERSQCGNSSFWLYIFVRSIADLFLAATVVLITTAVVIATRETSTGRGDVGKQFAAGALGFAIFAPIIGGCANGGYLESIICFTVLAALAVLLLLADNSIPLSPPEWWWHTRCGLLALPMSSVRKYGWEVASLGLVLFLLGVFWSAIDSFLPWHIVNEENGEPLVIGMTVTVGAIPAVIFLIFAEIFVDYCGHNNILIFCFVNYICHHLGLMFFDNAWYILICEWLEVFTLHIMYITTVLYLRHLVPRKFTACGQALPIIAHFCLGRCIGVVLGGLAFSDFNSEYVFQNVHKYFCVAAVVVAIIYFCLYHFYLKAYCIPPVHLPPAPAPALIQSMNGNGAYTPLRVYHNSKSKKGHFRY
ncbi:uncharacterized protein LOC114342800 [Diabrotica virgifera virgifera]|uniref:Major facilitator superfamily associated domain-containing protein n=2 Tax=Diabrotica virgifera virgifera TaxID=50390 RepID=A0ABM5KE07_DIAVI|nr:uncharacterized protein LOC114342800 [Diabrotica virgifera virgifera]XP_050508393.1 uncharacterized protein LOC114342800 [Diabrotica virgifera virgifera]XP_050508394.1 uncharacterized protein LOC114342800 [Diabrotica virgifera virgifera]